MALQSYDAAAAAELPGQAQEQADYHVYWKGTFIDVKMPDDEGDDQPCLKRRSLSDSDVRSETSGTSFMGDRQYCDTLSDRLSAMWVARRQRPAEDASDMASVCSTDSAVSLRSMFSEPSMTNATLDPASGSSPTEAMPSYLGSMTPDTVSAMDTAASAAAGVGGATVFSKSVTRKEIKTTIRDQVREISKNMRRQTRAEMLARIEELPEQLDEALQLSATEIVKDMQDRVAMLSDIIREGAPGEGHPMQVAKAVERLATIPDLMQSSLEMHMAQAKDMVQQRIGVLVQDLANVRSPDGLASQQEVEDQVKQLSKDLQALACGVICDSLKESKEQAQHQIELVMDKLPEAAQSQIAEVTQSVEDATSEAASHVQAKALVDLDPLGQLLTEPDPGADAGMAMAVTNQVVADVLLRAKVSAEDTGGSAICEGSDGTDARAGGDGSAAGASELKLVNIGSLGHPQLCSRPCLYFASGTCVNGPSCEFCHLPHLKRPAHLDKRNRDLIKEMGASEAAEFILPMVSQKIVEIDASPETAACAAKLYQECCPNGPTTAREDPSRPERALVRALKVMSVRQLLCMLGSLLPSDSPQRRDVDGFLEYLRRVQMERLDR